MSDLKVQLVHLDGPFKGEIQDFFESVIAIGRHPDCQLVFPKECGAISRKHAEIIREGDRFRFVDESANGTLINGKAQKDVFLKDGDVLIIGGEGGPKVSFLSSPLEPGDAEAMAAVAAAEKTVPVPEAPSAKALPLKKESAQEISPPRFVPKPSPAPQPESPKPQAPPLKSPPAVAKTLIIQYGATLTSFKQLPITIGSGADCDCTLQHQELSTEHAQIFFRDEQYWVKDLTGRGLLTINQQAVQDESPLPPDSCLALTTKGPEFQFLGEGRLAEIEPTEVKQKQSSANRQKTQGTRRSEDNSSNGNSKMIWLLIALLGLGGAVAALYYFQPTLFTDLL